MKQQAPYTAEELFIGMFANRMREWKNSLAHPPFIDTVHLPDYGLTELGIAVLDMAGRHKDIIDSDTVAALFD